MSDEEKKAIESLKKDLDCTVITFCKAGLEDIKIVLNLIEKQSKEIEELKEDRKSYTEEYIHNNPWLYKQLNENYILKTEAEQKEKEANNEGYFQGRRDERDETDDHIKAKIEELKKDLKEELDALGYGVDIVLAITSLQSLLEKE